MEFSTVSGPPDTGARETAELSSWSVALHIFALCGFAIAQPVFSVLSSNADLFAARRSEAPELVLFAVALTFLPPLILVAFVWIVRRLTSRWLIAFYGLVWLLLALLSLQIVSEFSQPPWIVSVAGAAALAALGLWAYAQTQFVRQFLSVLAAAPLIFMGLFLFSGSAAPFVLTTAPVGSVEVTKSTDDSIVYLVLDEFAAASIVTPDGSIDRERFPNFADIADDSYWFPTTVAAHVYTTRATSGMFTGNYSIDGASATAEDYPENMFTLLGATHEMHAIEPQTDFCPETICGVQEVNRWTVFEIKGLLRTAVEIEKRALLPQLYDDTFLTLDDPFGVFGGTQIAPPEDESFSERVTDQILADQVELWDGWLNTISADKSQFYYRHVFLPHAPYRYLPDGTRYNTDSQVIPALNSDGYWIGDPWHTIDAHQRHLLQVQALDLLIGRLKQRLVDLGIYDDTMIVITSDHGVSHVPGSARRDFTEVTAGHVGLVPLIMKAPGQTEGVVWDSPMSALDILPTMAEMIGIEVPWETEGRSVLQSPRTSASIQSQTGEIIEVTDSDLQAAISFVQGRFPHLDSPFDIYSYDGFEILLGRSISDIDAGQSDSTTVLDDPAAYDSVDFSSGRVPAFISGTVNGIANSSESTHVAVVVNDVVVSVVPLHDFEGDTALFGAVAPLDYLVDGPNVIKILIVTGDSAAPTLLESTVVAS